MAYYVGDYERELALAAQASQSSPQTDTDRFIVAASRASPRTRRATLLARQSCGSGRWNSRSVSTIRHLLWASGGATAPVMGSRRRPPLREPRGRTSRANGVSFPRCRSHFRWRRRSWWAVARFDLAYASARRAGGSWRIRAAWAAAGTSRTWRRSTLYAETSSRRVSTSRRLRRWLQQAAHVCWAEGSLGAGAARPRSGPTVGRA